MKRYTSSVHHRQPRPRSKRLLGLGGGGSSSSTTVVNGMSGGGGSDMFGSGHTHSNKEDLDRLKLDDLGYLKYLAQQESEDEESFESGYQKVSAGNADKWDGRKFPDFMNQPVRSNDTVRFAKVIAEIMASPDFASGIEAGCGWGIDRGGNGEMTSLTLRSFLKVPQLIYNKVRVTGGEMWNTEGGVIAEVSQDPDSDTAYILTMDVEDGDTIELDIDDICKGHYNNNGGFVTSYFRVTAVDQAAKTMRIVLGADAEVPGGVNHPPVPYMNIARYGNFTVKERQRSQYFSSSERRIALLRDVDQYIIVPAHYEVVIGSVPDALIPDNRPGADRPSIYLETVLARRIVQIDNSGSVVRNIRDRGLWEQEPPEPYQYTSDVQDEVYHKSCKYRCIVDGTTAEPRYDSTDWLLVAGDTTLTMTIESTAGETFLYGALSTELIATVKRGLEDITDSILDADWSWSRETGDVAADTVWNTDHAGCGRQISLGNEDLTAVSGRFICSAYVRDGAVTLMEEVLF